MIDDVDILLFDEPLANLDPATGKRAIALIDSIQKEQNKTILIIEHRLEDALYKDVDRIVVVGDGRIVADMTPDQLLSCDILMKEGIREPLYVTALKHAGCTISEKDRPAHVETMDFSAYKGQVQEWFASAQTPAKGKNSQVALAVEHLDFSYDAKHPILQDIDFSVNKGEMISIVGKNGAGKTTLSSLICGFLQPDKGRILLDGQDIAPLSIKERGEKIGIVMQNPNQMISKAMIYDEVALGLAVRGVSEDEIKERVYETLKICGLYPFRNWPISALSFGQKKRVTIASILVMNPQIMILDEPTSYLDIRHKLELLEILRKMAKEKEITVIMSLHEIDLAQKISDKVVCVKGDRIAGFGNPEEIFTEEKIRELYGIDNGYYDPCFGSVELPRVVGKPEVFVLSSCGTGIPVYRKLQKAGIPFAAGILYPGECDYQLARLLASEIISEEPYEPISCETYRKALEMMEQCKKVINAGVKTGKMNQKAGELLKIAEERGMLI
mgnify:CR=1 FL=1